MNGSGDGNGSGSGSGGGGTGTVMGDRRGRRARQSGFTLIELLAYLAIFTSFTGTVVGVEIVARKMNRIEATTLEAMDQVDGLFEAIATDCEKASGVRAETGTRKELVFTGGGSYVARGGEVLRDGRAVARSVHHVGFFRPDPAKHPRLVRVSVQFRRDWGPNESFERLYERTFLVRNLEGDGRGGL